ncbi:MAG: hypothetical protein V2A66_01750 [Pseudomonadota bacterium]
MMYVVAIAVLVIFSIILTKIRDVCRNAALFRNICNSTVMRGSEEAPFVEWLLEKPNRNEQKNIFLQLMTERGLSKAQCAESVVRCIKNSRMPDGKPFGQLLSFEINSHVSPDDPAKELLSEAKARLTALD